MSHLGVLPSCYVPSWCIAMGASLKYEKVVFNGEQKKNHLCEDWIEKSVPWDQSSLDKPLDSGPRDGPFYPTLTLMIDSNKIECAGLNVFVNSFTVYIS